MSENDAADETPTMNDPTSRRPARRQFLHAGLRRGATLSAIAALPSLALAERSGPAATRDLVMSHLHTNERIEIVYARGDRYLPAALESLNHFLRDHYSGAVGRIEPRLHDLLHAVRAVLGTDRPYEVVSGYRSQATNAFLQATRGGGVATHSLHMEGRAIDVRVPGVPLADLRDAAQSLQAGGVGYYPREQFVHIDTGRVRRW
jgi:uncharacterized protein YcbK (DUF882 family)